MYNTSTIKTTKSKWVSSTRLWQEKVPANILVLIPPLNLFLCLPTVFLAAYAYKHTPVLNMLAGTQMRTLMYTHLPVGGGRCSLQRALQHTGGSGCLKVESY